MEASLYPEAGPMTTATPTRVTSIELAADTLTPVAAALRLGGRCAFLLESVEGGARYGRYSIAGVHGRTLVVDGSDDPLEVLRAELPRSEERRVADACRWRWWSRYCKDRVCAS